MATLDKLLDILEHAGMEPDKLREAQKEILRLRTELTKLNQVNPSEAARLIASQRRQFVGDCLQCGKQIIGIKKRRFCDDICSQRYRRGQARAARKEAQEATGTR